MTEHPLLRQARVEAANEMGNALINVINAHVRAHGKNDPELKNILLAAVASVVLEISLRVHPCFARVLAEMITEEGFLPDEDT